MMLRGLGVAVLCGLALEAPALAQVSPPPLPPSVVVPDIAADSRALGDERKYFVFHQQNLSLAQARADLSYCFRYTQLGAGVIFPYFHPWDRAPGSGERATYDFGGQYGLTGSVIGAIIAGPIERSKRQMSVMRCMIPRGYARYRVSEGLWKEINGSDVPQSIEIQARLASGPVPPTARVLP